MEKKNFGKKYESTRKYAEPPLWKKWERLAKREGLRRTIYALNGDRYLGEWRDDRKHGVGTYWYKKSGEIYSGNWVKDKRSGYGTLSIPHPTIENDYWKYYIGDWKYDKQHGYGICYFTNGDVYEGQWKYGKMCGWGRMIYHDGNIYEGEWENGTCSGLGINVSENDSYEGSWKNNERNGSGILKLKDKGTVINGFWMEGYLRCGVLQDDEDKHLTSYLPLPPIELVNVNKVLRDAEQDVKMRYRTKHDDVLTELPAVTEMSSSLEKLNEDFEEDRRGVEVLDKTLDECVLEEKENLISFEENAEETNEGTKTTNSYHSLTTPSDLSN